ncbi:glutathione S-transferase family protein [Pararhizobium sp. IMCC21322]|uniref:glutathione S-transferase family protein n=1 Tax=Pararhizobium sp. IMCC21322 TaxID=3067903 RepID=UPI0027414E57|nr:glutathione S-transferase family protein [Pararhizobium sp. IMCC21322]
MSEPEITLYHSLTSVCSQKVRLTLAELGLGFQSRVMDLKKGDQFAPDYLKLNPNAVVPTLIDGTQVVLNSNTILQHLCARNAAHPLSTATVDRQELCSQWFERADRLHVAIHAITYVSVNREKLLALSPEQREQRYQNIPDPVRSARLRRIVDDGFESAPVLAALETLNEILPKLQTALRGYRCLTGDRATLADFAMFPFVHRLHLLGFDPLWEEGNLARWHGDMMQRPSFQTAIRTVVPASATDNFAASGKAAWPQLGVRFN